MIDLTNEFFSYFNQKKNSGSEDYIRLLKMNTNNICKHVETKDQGINPMKPTRHIIITNTQHSGRRVEKNPGSLPNREGNY